MSKFKYIFELETGPHRYMSGDEALKAEQAYQLRRIADALEAQKPIIFDGRIFERNNIRIVTEAYELCSDEHRFEVYRSKGPYEQFHYKTKEAAEAGRAEFIRLLGGE